MGLSLGKGCGVGAYGPGFWETFPYSVLPALISALATFVGISFGTFLSGKRLISGTRPGEGPSRALSIAQERYARGELSRRGFEQMRGVLEGPEGG